MTLPIIRPIKPDDNAAVKTLVLETLAEFGLHGEGFAGVDEELEDMHAAYADELSAYYVIALDDKIVGVGGYAPLLGTDRGTTVELRKMYLTSAFRGQGFGQRLIDLCIKEATAKNFSVMYLETVPEMKAAQALYLKNGFDYSQRMGDTGHCNCSVTMVRDLNG